MDRWIQIKKKQYGLSSEQILSAFQEKLLIQLNKRGLGVTFYHCDAEV